MKLKILFGCSQLPGALAIRGWTWSDWSHTALLFDEPSIVDTPEIIEAVAFKGVISTGYTEFLKRYKYVASVDIELTETQYREALALSRAQLGKGYDWFAIAGIVFKRDWHRPDRWICSEMCPWVLESVGNPIIRTDNKLNRVVPQHLWILNLPTTYLK